MRCPSLTSSFPMMSGTAMSNTGMSNTGMFNTGMSNTGMPMTRHYSWHSGMNTADNAVFAVFAAAAKGAKPVAQVNKKRSPQRLGEALR